MTETPMRTRPLNVLLIDDDDGDALAVERAFKTARIANPIIRAHDGGDGLALLREEGRRGLTSPFVILLDLNMPRMNGQEFLKELRADPELRRLTVFMLSTSRDQADIDGAYDKNVAGYIIKDTAGDDFLKLVSPLEAYWRMVEVSDV
ncbi:MAG: response regulator [Rhodobacteraceae bacterium]|nr:response regulator [Paracoccaceae bacterium]MBR9819670.1 response regulator [Paracoccaceae bacterium]